MSESKSNRKPHSRRPLEDRFWERVGSPDKNDCWPWIGSKQPRGYGKICEGGRKVQHF